MGAHTLLAIEEHGEKGCKLGGLFPERTAGPNETTNIATWLPSQMKMNFACGPLGFTCLFGSNYIHNCVGSVLKFYEASVVLKVSNSFNSSPVAPHSR